MADDDVDEHRYAALASQTRRNVLQVVVDAAVPTDATTIARATRLHVSTVRFHLDQLENAGLVRRETAREGRRGRPHMLYSPGPGVREAEAQTELTRALVEVIASDPDATGRALTVGRRWAQSSPAVATAATKGKEASTELIESLDRLGFNPEDPSQATDDVRLLACPFRDLAPGENHVVCTVHRGLIEGAVEALGQSPDDVSLLPFVEPDVCMVRLRGALRRKNPVAKTD